MGKTRDTGFLTDCVFTDSSNNVGIGAAASGSYKLQVTGTSNFTSTINGAGVSLSDTLNGTTANFTSSVTGNFFIASPVATSAQSGGLRLNSQVAINARNAANSADITLITTNSSDGVAIRNGALNINSSGNVSIGTTSSGGRLDVQAGGTSAFTYYFRNNAGGYGGGVYNTGSNNTQLYLATSAGTENVVLSASGSSYFLGGNLGIGTSNVTEGTQAAGSISIIPVSSVSSAPLIQFPGNGRIRPASTGDRLSIDGNALFLNSTFGANVIMATGGGNASVGTTSPQAKLDVVDSSYNQYTLRVQSSAGNNANGWGGIGLSGEGSNTKAAILFLSDGGSYSRGSIIFCNNADFNQNNATPANERMRITSTGLVSISNLAGSGTRTVTADASGYLAASSDSSLKQEDTNHQIEGLSEILKLKPRAYKWLKDIELRGESAVTEIGFFADEVAPIIASAAPKCQDGLYGFYDRAVIAALVKAIQELNAKVSALENKS